MLLLYMLLDVMAKTIPAKDLVKYYTQKAKNGIDIALHARQAVMK